MADENIPVSKEPVAEQPEDEKPFLPESSEAVDYEKLYNKLAEENPRPSNPENLEDIQLYSPHQPDNTDSAPEQNLPPSRKDDTPTQREDSGPCISPVPSGEELPEEDIDKIISKTQEILKLCQTKVDEHKIECHSLAFMLLRIQESLNAYHKDYIPKLNVFLVQADKITAEYFAHMCATLPIYGDYVKAIEAEEGATIDVGAGPPVSKQKLLDLVRGVVDNYYAGAMFLKTGRTVYKDVNNGMSERTEMVNTINAPMPSWIEIQDNVTYQLENIREQTFKIATYIDFLKQGEAKTGPALDFSALKKKDNTKNKEKE